MSKKILSPLRRDGYKAGMIMMLIALSTMLLTTACSSDDEFVTNNTAENTVTSKGYALPVTINVTREGDATTRATYNESTGKLSFSAGDKLFVWSYNGGSASEYAGVLDRVSDGTFSGTIYTQNPYTGTIDALLSGGDPAAAVLLPAGYGDYGYLSTEGNSGSYNDEFTEDKTKAFVASTTEKTAKALAVEQLSFETGSYTSGTGFALSPNNAILNFTITGLTASTNVTATIKKGEDVLVSGSVTTDGSGNATFAMGIESATEINPLTLTVGGKEITITSTNTVFDAGKIYNITRVVNAINGKFTINASGDQVYFSKGNLRYESGTWSFFDTQYGRYGTYSADAWDLFGWVGTTGTLTSGAELWGASTSNTAAGYGASTSDKLKSDWGNVPGIGSGWRTLSGGDSGEWNYLFNTRSASTVGGTENGRYAKGTVNGVHGVILFPDTYTHPSDVMAPTNVNTANASFDSNTYTIADWAKMEAAGCVFLPTTGTRTGTGVNYVNRGYYWSSTAHNNDERFAYGVHFYSDNLDADDYNGRWWGQSVRLVRDVE